MPRGKKTKKNKQTGKNVVKDTHKLWLSVHMIHCVRKASHSEAGFNRPAGELGLLQMSFLPTAYGPVSHPSLFVITQKRKAEVPRWS